VTIQGRGSRLIGKAQSVELEQKAVIQLLVDGFFPLVKPEDQSVAEKRLGMKTIGLPYATDPRITAQLAHFLSRNSELETGKIEHFVIPKAVLFNGGSLKAVQFRLRLLEQLNVWAKAFEKPEVNELPGPDFDFAVSKGAAFYALARRGKTIRVKSGIPQSYYVGIEEAVPAVPGMSPPIKAICIAPIGMEEGTSLDLPSQQFALHLGENIAFRFFASSTGEDNPPAVGHALKRWQGVLTELPPITVSLDQEGVDGELVHVRLSSHVTELGILELYCQSEAGKRWKLSFSVR